MKKPVLFALMLYTAYFTIAQPVEVRSDYNDVGNVDFVAYNNTKAPLFVSVILGDLQNTDYAGPMPIVKMLEPGFNTLFTLEKQIGSEGQVQFHYESKYYLSDPKGGFNYDFPYLIPLMPGRKVKSVLVKDINGFMGPKVPKSWTATGFKGQPGDKVFAARNGIIVEIAGEKRKAGKLLDYNGWDNAATILQPDGTLACYRNVAVNEKKWETGDKIYAGQLLGEIADGANELDFLIYHEIPGSKGLTFIAPQFVLSEGKTDLILSGTELTVAHPPEIRVLEMDKKEKRKFNKK